MQKYPAPRYNKICLSVGYTYLYPVDDPIDVYSWREEKTPNFNCLQTSKKLHVLWTFRIQNLFPQAIEASAVPSFSLFNLVNTKWPHRATTSRIGTRVLTPTSFLRHSLTRRGNFQECTSWINDLSFRWDRLIYLLARLIVAQRSWIFISHHFSNHFFTVPNSLRTPIIIPYAKRYCNPDFHNNTVNRPTFRNIFHWDLVKNHWPLNTCEDTTRSVN